MNDEQIYNDLVAEIEAMRNEQIRLTQEALDIDGQLTDRERGARYASEEEYRDWRARAIHAKRQCIIRAGILKNKIRNLNKRENALRIRLAQERKQQRGNVASAEDARALEKLAAIDDPEIELVRRLYVALARLYRKYGLEPGAEDRETFDLAFAFLVDQGVFEHQKGQPNGA